MYDKKRAGAEKFAEALHNATKDKTKVADLAKLLDYDADQMQQDIKSIWELTGDSITATAAKGFLLSGMVGILVNKETRERVLDGFNVAMENMTEEEAEEVTREPDLYSGQVDLKRKRQ